MKAFGLVAAAGMAVAGIGMAGCNAQPGSPVTSVAAQPRQTFADSSPSERREGGSGQRRGGRAQANAAPGVFDFYLLTLSWSPEYCVTHQGAAECTAHPAFVLHGLWPQNNDGTYPEDCSNAPGPANPGIAVQRHLSRCQVCWRMNGPRMERAPGWRRMRTFNWSGRRFTASLVRNSLTALKSQIQLDAEPDPCGLYTGQSQHGRG
jgi:hypothetical protein